MTGYTRNETLVIMFAFVIALIFPFVPTIVFLIVGVIYLLWVFVPIFKNHKEENHSRREKKNGNPEGFKEYEDENNIEFFSIKENL